MTDVLGRSKLPQTGYPVIDLIAGRWSPRGFDATHTLSVDDLGSLLEAARWSPSSSNTQPWRLVVAQRGSVDFDRIIGTLEGSNGLWAPAASAFVVMCAQTVDADGQPLKWAMYDTGQAAAYLSMQAEAMGLSVHQMGGFRGDELREVLHLSDDLRPMTVIAVGKFDPHAELPDSLAEREQATRLRRALTDSVRGGWPPA